MLCKTRCSRIRKTYQNNFFYVADYENIKFERTAVSNNDMKPSDGFMVTLMIAILSRKSVNNYCTVIDSFELCNLL